MNAKRAVAAAWLVALALAPAASRADALDSARVQREEARAELARAQAAFDRADEAYIRALGGSAAKRQAALAPAADAPSRGRIVTFTMGGIGAMEVSPLDYRARLIVDRHPGAWTQHTSGTRLPVPGEAQSLAYEVQRNDGAATAPQWKTICAADLPLKSATTLEVVVAQTTSCRTK